MKNNSSPDGLSVGISGQDPELFFPRSRYDYLLNQEIITMGQLKKAAVISKKTRRSLESALINQFKIKKDDVGKSLSLFYNCPFKSFDKETETPFELLRNLKKSFLLTDRWVPIASDDDEIVILIDNPRDIQKTDHIRTLIKTEKQIRYNVGIAEDIDAYIRLFFDKQGHQLQSSDDMLAELNLMQDIPVEEEVELEEEADLYDEQSSVVVRLVNQILVTAFQKKVSDIHVEPSPISKWTQVRFRLDGVCQKYIEVPNTMTNAILSRLKIMAGLDIAERRLPQDGKIKFRAKGIPPFELRIATLPTSGGYEDAVLRVLAKAGAMKFDDMGLNKRNLNSMKGMITQPYGLVLVVGPTGSGKTTTLHSALGYINKPGIKIWTAEDPVEITQEGLRQVEVKPKIGLDFARVMRAFLRADPDVIMIGEMRDYETASTGVEASLTGHLVFSTLHTNSAPETVTRLLDMGLNPLNFSDAFLGVLAQRLVRRLCLECRKPYHPSADEFDEIVSEYGKSHFGKTGITYSSKLTLYKSVGCPKCSQSGYRGRLGIHELMAGSPKIKLLIKKSAPTNELFDQSMAEGMTTLKQDGIIKSFQGLTDLLEVRRVCIE